MECREHSIVIVEDEGLIAVDLRGRLERAGYRVPGMAGTAVEALDVIREKSPDLILMDIRLRGNTDGIQVAQQVRQDFDIPVVYLTAYEDPKTLERASESQAYGYIKKPIDGASLEGSIEMAISRHRHDRHLREQRDWFSASFGAIPDAVLVTDGFGRIGYLNPVAQELLGSKAVDAFGKPYRELLRLMHRNGEIIEDLMPVVMLQEATIELPIDIWLEGDRGRRYAIEGNLAPRWRDGRIDGVLVTFKDVTRRRFEQEHSRQDHKHEALSRLADGLAGHLDLELVVVAEQNAVLLNALPEESPLRPPAEAIGAAAMEVAKVTSRLRAYGQDWEIKPQVVHVNETLAGLEKTWRQTMPGLTVQLDPAPRPVHADSHRLTRVLEALLKHARHWTGSGGTIAVAARGAELEGLPEWVLIRVAYQSTGEDARSLERAFDPSWDGNWDGLPAVYSVARRMGSLLSARMEKDQTVFFEIYLPSIEIAAAGAPIEGENERVLLLIEPNSEVRRRLEAHFEQHGYSVVGACDCEEALLLAQSNERPIRLVIGNPAKDDEYRAGLVERMANLNAGISVRLIEGYREEEASTPENAGRFLNKWELLEWANDTLAPLSRMGAAN